MIFDRYFANEQQQESEKETKKNQLFKNRDIKIFSLIDNTNTNKILKMKNQ